jgi:hypothetical protein
MGQAFLLSYQDLQSSFYSLLNKKPLYENIKNNNSCL